MIPAAAGAWTDLCDPDLVRVGGPELLLEFNRTGVLTAADVHAAVRLTAMAGERDEMVALAVALAMRAPRVGQVSVDLSTIHTSAFDGAEEIPPDDLPWPEVGGWLERVAGSGLVALEPLAVAGERPLVLWRRSLYLQRYWLDEVLVADRIRSWTSAAPAPAGASAAPAPAGAAADGADPRAVPDTSERLARLFPGEASSDQRAAARTALDRPFTVIAGGPGTGKTTTVARLLTLLFEEAEAAGRRAPLVGLAAPTGKAAARMEEAVRAEAGRLDTSAAAARALSEVKGSTLHRLLGARFDRPGRFRHHAGHRLPHDVVVVDEASMVALSLMARLVEAVRSDARLVLVGDPYQLVSVEAGAVLADIVGGARPPAPAHPPHGADPPEGARPPAPAHPPDGDDPPGLRPSIAFLRRNHRFTGALADLADSVRSGSVSDVMAVLTGGDATAAWVDAEPAELVGAGGGSSGAVLPQVRQPVESWASAVRAAALAGDTAGALDALGRRRVLCAHRRGPAGAGAWSRRIEAWLDGSPEAVAVEASWYAGRPVLVTANDYALRLFNGDAGVALVAAGDLAASGPDGGRLVVAFQEGPGRPPRLISPTRLSAVETVFAMTVHKSQGSEFDHVTLLLPPAGSRLLTRELLYTAVTRARRSVTVVGSAEALKRAVMTPIARASGLGPRLWGRPETS